jgi:hypothetical protein
MVVLKFLSASANRRLESFISACVAPNCSWNSFVNREFIREKVGEYLNYAADQGGMECMKAVTSADASENPAVISSGALDASVTSRP